MWNVFGLALGLLLVSSSALAGQLTAGDVDDHLNFDDYLDFIDAAGLPLLDLSDRITIRISDSSGRPFSHAKVSITASGRRDAASLVAGADGVLRLFPALDGFQGNAILTLKVQAPDGSMTTISELDTGALGPEREYAVVLPGQAHAPQALDLMVVLDTTGSMGDEIGYLKEEFQAIAARILDESPGVEIRFGLTAYRDRSGPEFITRPYGFTSSLDTMQEWLGEMASQGNHDWPEAVEDGLRDALSADWRGYDASQVLLLVGDAPPYPERMAAALDLVHQGRNAGIRIYPLGASDIATDPMGEQFFRAAAVLTQGRYLFLTDDSGLGNPHGEPSIRCYVVTDLDNLLRRVVQSELTGLRVEPAPEEVLRTVGGYRAGMCDAPAPSSGVAPSASLAQGMVVADEAPTLFLLIVGIVIVVTGIASAVYVGQRRQRAGPKRRDAR